MKPGHHKALKKEINVCLPVAGKLVDLIDLLLRPKKKIMSVSSDMSKNIRVGRSENFFFYFLFFLKKS